MPGYGAPMMPNRGLNAGGGSMLKTVGGAILAVVVFGGFGLVKLFLPKPGIESVSALGIENKKADPDKMIAGAAAYAKKWRSDAAFWSINIQQLGSDGTVDLSSSNVTVEYFSPSSVSSPLTTVRDDSIKKFNFLDGKMHYDEKWGVRKQYSPPPRGTAIPGCTAKKLAAVLMSKGILKAGATVHAQIDPEFGDAWLVQTGSKPAQFDLATCAQKN